MKTTESMEEVEIESRPIKVTRFAFLGSVLFWPLFLFATKFMLDPPLRNTTAEAERAALVYCTWLYPVAVGLGWFLSKRAMRRGSPDIVCLLPWVIPAMSACYWLVYFFL
jgi:drug/metabolite transporter (DMT)-like permease